ncbi:hypothetical protein jhhlp_001281 [Lomentospora prolificans]|uniref:Zn(2)-C6 fungal-type domain-containing protein n=1 Tax=Lomentospora prolificans TaxID=41688 RepID=A0A2N3NHS2_9PEZI|nr:hypothetical protein jhhlp_001281 [Lomentospora prolificans]
MAKNRRNLGVRSAKAKGSRPVACLNCRNRRSYCSKDKPSCSRCIENELVCVYEGTRKVLVTEAYLRELQAKAWAYESSGDLKADSCAIIENNVASEQSPEGTSVAGYSEREEEDEDEEDFGDGRQLLEPFTQLTLDKLSTSFKGPGSSDNFLRSVRKLSGLPGDDGSLDTNPNFYEPGALPSRRVISRLHVRLPPFDIARRLFAAQYTYIGTIFAFAPPEDTLQLLLLAYRGPPDPSDKDACLSYAKVLVLLAFGQLYSVNQWVSFRGPPGFDYFSSALSLLPEAYEEGSIACVETLALVGYFMQNLNRRDAAFLYIGMAMRMAISLGLHHEISPSAMPADPSDPSHTTEEALREHRRRVWWSIYSLDRILSVKSGNPITIQDEDIGVNLPSRLPHESEYCPAVVLGHYTQLSRILGKIHMTIYRRSAALFPKSGKSLMASVQEIVLALSNWNRQLPDELRFDPARLSVSRESVSTFSHYYQCINMTVRPLLFYVVQKRLQNIQSSGDPLEKERDWREGLSSSTVKMIDLCINGAKDVVNMMTWAAQKDLVATYGYMDGDHVFSAAIALVMACVAFPTNSSNTIAMNAGLALLRVMSERGNTHIAARYELLDNIRRAALPNQYQHHHQHADPASDELSPLAPMSTAELHLGKTENTVAGGWREGLARADMDWLDCGLAGHVDFPMVDNSVLGEPFFDENASSGMDYGLWEEVFANPTMESSFDFPQWTQVAAEMFHSSERTDS